MFCDFIITEDKLANDFGDIRFLLVAEATNVISQGAIPDFVENFINNFIYLNEGTYMEHGSILVRSQH